MAVSLPELVQRSHRYAIVDEVDSILIDEARTPLIISGPLDDRSDFYNTIDAYIPKLDTAAKVDYEVDEKQRTVALSEAGMFVAASCALVVSRHRIEAAPSGEMTL